MMICIIRIRGGGSRRATLPLDVMAGLVPAVPLRKALCPSKRGHRDKPGDDKSPSECLTTVIAGPDPGTSIFWKSCYIEA